MKTKEVRNYIDSHREDIEGIKVTVFLLDPNYISIEKILAFSIKWEYKYFLQTNDKDYLLTGVLIIQAYLELGFTYDFVSKYSKPIIEALNIEFSSFYKPYYAEKVKLNKTQVGRLLARWRYPRTNGLKKPEIINDIITKVSTCQVGIYTYQNGMGNIYKSIVKQNGCYFHDKTCNRYYIFE